MNGHELERRLRRAMARIGFVTGGSGHLDHNRKTDILVIRLDGEWLRPPISIQITLRVRDAEKRLNFIKSAAAQDERFLYVEVDDGGGFVEPDTEELARILRHLIKTQLRYRIWKKPLGYTISCLTGEIEMFEDFEATEKPAS